MHLGRWLLGRMCLGAPLHSFACRRAATLSRLTNCQSRRKAKKSAASGKKQATATKDYSQVQARLTVIKRQLHRTSDRGLKCGFSVSSTLTESTTTMEKPIKNLNLLILILQLGIPINETPKAPLLSELGESIATDLCTSETSDS
ncbi:hypothetical protein GW17_00007762 [Ensete ventricosum]|nr:hypothetical protein GW17_00007762 [Ensete ventricosum]RZR78471.1 hypothetical protein BHM03_00003824 [Ensete ventricosum]